MAFLAHQQCHARHGIDHFTRQTVGWENDWKKRSCSYREMSVWASVCKKKKSAGLKFPPNSPAATSSMMFKWNWFLEVWAFCFKTSLRWNRASSLEEETVRELRLPKFNGKFPHFRSISNQTPGRKRVGFPSNSEPKLKSLRMKPW